MGILQASVWFMTLSENVSSRKGVGMLPEFCKRAVISWLLAATWDTHNVSTDEGIRPRV